jgi:hypothetical protein
MVVLHHLAHGSVPAEGPPRALEADAVVLFDRLMSVDLNAVPITHPAKKQALAHAPGTGD